VSVCVVHLTRARACIDDAIGLMATFPGNRNTGAP
jgi:hypothetical protein